MHMTGVGQYPMRTRCFFPTDLSLGLDTSKSSILVVCFTSLHLGFRKVQVGKDQEKAQSEKDSHSKNRGGKKPN